MTEKSDDLENKMRNFKQKLVDLKKTGELGIVSACVDGNENIDPVLKSIFLRAADSVMKEKNIDLNDKKDNKLD